MDHFNDITYLLTKYFDFKITNIYYSKKIDNNIKDLKTDNFEYIDTLKYYYNLNENQLAIQCSNLFDFPINFL